VPSFTGDAIVEKAKECYALGLIDRRKLERVIVEADRPGYDPILDLPFDWEVEDARNLARKAAVRECPQAVRRWWRFW
jgi:hypothetical protein